MDIVLAAAGAVAFVVAASLRHLQRWSISPPLLGLLAGMLLGPEAIDVLRLPPGQEIAIMKIAARLLLAVALMAIALRYPLAAVRARVGEVALLLAVVLPVMAAVLAAGAVSTLGLPLGFALVLGACLSPTDPVLASGIVTGEPAEQDIPPRARQALSLESGANDALALPFVVLALAGVLGRELPQEGARLVYEVLGGVALGVGAGWVAGHTLRWAERHREIEQSVRALYTLVLAMFLLGLGGVARVNGLLGVLVAGLTHSAIVSGRDRKVEVGVDEALNQFLVIPVFVLLGVAAPWERWGDLGWGGVGFVLVALFLRRLPVVLVLRRPLRADWPHVVWLGWFGPIGVAALYYLGHIEEQGLTHPGLWAAGTLVVVVSTIVHGLTSAAGRLAYRRAGD